MEIGKILQIMVVSITTGVIAFLFWIIRRSYLNIFNTLEKHTNSIEHGFETINQNLSNFKIECYKFFTPLTEHKEFEKEIKEKIYKVK